MILDGDGAIFKESLINEGYRGGVEAARRLNTAIRTHLQEAHQTNVGDWKIQVLIVLNQEGLAMTLHASGLVINAREKLQAFIQGFNNGQSLYNMEDVGDAKEAADRKVRSAFELMAYNRQCRHIILGGCHDNGYLSWLEEFNENPDITRVSLLETYPARPGYRSLNWKIWNFPDVFRSAPIRKEDHSRALRSPKLLNHDQADLVTVPVTSGNKIHNGAGQQTDSLSSAAERAPSSSPKYKIARLDIPYFEVNELGERIDDKLPDYSPAGKEGVEAMIKASKKHLCNFYYLSPSGCTNSDEACKHHHGRPITEEERKYLRTLARGIACRDGIACMDPDCFFGHNCRYGASCKLGDKCKFAGSHGIDMVSYSPRKHHVDLHY